MLDFLFHKKTQKKTHSSLRKELINLELKSFKIWNKPDMFWEEGF